MTIAGWWRKNVFTNEAISQGLSLFLGLVVTLGLLVFAAICFGGL